jgi:hypothetical protein
MQLTRAYPILQLVLCDLAEETIQYCLATCVFAREAWTILLFIKLRWPTLSPHPNDRILHWWSQSVKVVAKELQKGLNSHYVGRMGDMETPKCLVCLREEGILFLLLFRRLVLKVLFGAGLVLVPFTSSCLALTLRWGASYRMVAVWAMVLLVWWS